MNGVCEMNSNAELEKSEVYTYRERCQDQFKKLKNTKIIYLDTKYWLKLRQVNMRDNPTLEEIKLYDIVSELSRNGKAVFPISDVTLLEFMKQTDKKTLSNTLSLIMEFSKNISIRSYKERVNEEILDFIYYIKNFSSGVERCLTTKANYNAWTCVPYVFGKFSIVLQNEVAESYDMEVQKVMFENPITERIFLDVIVETTDRKSLYFDPSDLIKERRENSGNSHRKVWLEEFYNELFLYKDLLYSGLKGVYDLTNKRQVDKVFNLICSLRKKNKLDGFIPSVDVFSTLCATWLISQNTKIEYNHYFDLHHASAALPYCDVFLTEKSLHDAINRIVPKLITGINCKVCSNDTEAIELLKC